MEIEEIQKAKEKEIQHKTMADKKEKASEAPKINKKKLRKKVQAKNRRTKRRTKESAEKSKLQRDRETIKKS